MTETKKKKEVTPEEVMECLNASISKYAANTPNSIGGQIRAALVDVKKDLEFWAEPNRGIENHGPTHAYLIAFKHEMIQKHIYAALKGETED